MNLQQLFAFCQEKVPGDVDSRFIRDLWGSLEKTYDGLVACETFVNACFPESGAAAALAARQATEAAREGAEVCHMCSRANEPLPLNICTRSRVNAHLRLTICTRIKPAQVAGYRHWYGAGTVAGIGTALCWSVGCNRSPTPSPPARSSSFVCSLLFCVSADWVCAGALVQTPRLGACTTATSAAVAITTWDTAAAAAADPRPGATPVSQQRRCYPAGRHNKVGSRRKSRGSRRLSA